MPYNEWAKDFSNEELANTHKELSERLRKLEKKSPVCSRKPNKIIGFRNEYKKRLNALENEKSLRA